MQKTFFILFILLYFYGCGTTSQTANNSPSFSPLLKETFQEFNPSTWQKANWDMPKPFGCGWLEQNVEINGTNLLLHLSTTPAYGKEYSAAEYRTLNTYMYGKYSVKFQASDINGTISSFFTYTGEAEGTQWDEIDIEILGKDTTKMQVNYRRDGHEHPHIIDLGFDASKAIHLYSFIFTPEYIQWYVDDVLVYQVDENHLQNQDSLPINGGKIILNFWPAVDVDEWSGHYDGNSTGVVIYEEVRFEELI